MGDDRATAILLDTVMRHDLLSLDDARRQKLLRLLSDLRGSRETVITAELVEDAGWAATSYTELCVAHGELLRRVEEVRSAYCSQRVDGMWSEDPFQRGTSDGLKQAMRILEGKEPAFKSCSEALHGGEDAS
jgi:hypothetical protein